MLPEELIAITETDLWEFQQKISHCRYRISLEFHPIHCHYRYRFWARTRKTVKTAVFGCFSGCFFGCLTRTRSAPFLAVFRLFLMSGIWRSVDGHRDCCEPKKQSKQLFSVVFPVVFSAVWPGPAQHLFGCFPAVFNVGHLALCRWPQRLQGFLANAPELIRANRPNSRCKSPSHLSPLYFRRHCLQGGLRFALHGMHSVSHYSAIGDTISARGDTQWYLIRRGTPHRVFAKQACKERVGVSKARVLGRRFHLLSSPKGGKAPPIAKQPTVKEEHNIWRDKAIYSRILGRLPFTGGEQSLWRYYFMRCLL